MSDWAKLKVIELKAELKYRGLPQAGLKAELVARLQAADEEAALVQTSETRSPSVKLGDQPNHGESQGVSAVKAEDAGSATLKWDSQHGDLADNLEAESVVDATDTMPDEENIDVATVPLSHADDDHSAVTHVEHGSFGKSRGTRQSLASNQSSNASPARSHSHEEPPSMPSHQDATASALTTSESDFDALKRKRRSVSPTPKEEFVKRRRAAECAEDTSNRLVPLTSKADHDSGQATSPLYEKAKFEVRATNAEPPVATENAWIEREAVNEPAEPSLHAATAALYISNLMRPMREAQLRAHIADLALPAAAEPRDDVIAQFYLDNIRTHAFVVFESISAAVRVRNRLHGRVWPKESNRKMLFVDFIPVEKVQPWIEQEQSQLHEKKTGLRWELVYQRSEDDGNVDVTLRSNSATSSFNASQSREAGTTTAPAAGFGVEGAPTGPRGHSYSARPPLKESMPPPRESYPGPSSYLAHEYYPGPESYPEPESYPAPERHSGPPFSNSRRQSSVGRSSAQRTYSLPEIYYEPVPATMARRRLQDMWSFYTRDMAKPLDREINRYSFQDDDKFVDRGREVFEGIRPPYRQQAMEREMRLGNGGGRGGGRGGRPPYRGQPSFRSRGDWYLPGSGGGPLPAPADDYDYYHSAPRHSGGGGGDDYRRPW